MIKRYYTQHSLNLFTLELDEWEFPSHKHNFYELIFIKKGAGYHIINGIKFSYRVGNIFLLSPKDEHSFEITSKTTFEFIKFTEQLFLEKPNQQEKNNWQKSIENILYNPNTLPQDIIHKESDRSRLFQLRALLQEEDNNKILYSRQIVIELFGAMLLIIARNIHLQSKLQKKLPSSEEEKISEMLSYIRQHMMEKEKVSLKVIANKFFISENYVSIFIKKHTGLSIKRLVIETRLKSAERLLKQSNYTISEIALRLGFTDTAHFSNTFKKYKGHSPSLFRK
jgi:YesN/AraC family two-component response regulator